MNEHSDKLLPHIEVDPAIREHATILANLLELYAHDFSEFHNFDLGPAGRFVYKSLPLYWSEPEPISVPYRGRWQTSVTGLVKRESEISGNQTVWDMAEFFVLRGCRRLPAELASNSADCAAYSLLDPKFGEWFIPWHQRSLNQSSGVTRPIHDHRMVESSPNGPKPSGIEDATTEISVAGDSLNPGRLLVIDRMADKPPSTDNSTPFTKLESSEARNSATVAISSG